MTVEELINALKKFDSTYEVFIDDSEYMECVIPVSKVDEINNVTYYTDVYKFGSQRTINSGILLF